MILLVGISGASGVIYGIRLLKVLSSKKGIETHLIMSDVAKSNLRAETDYELENVKSLADYYYDNSDIGARLASGSFKRDGMIVAPCSVKTMSAIANSYSDNLLTRAADVTLKERRRLVLLVRETPLHLGHISTMEKATKIGAIIMPPVPAFYHKPKTVQDVIDHTIGKVLDLLDIEHDLFQRWSGFNSE